jgi:hypothetical protein
MDAALGPGTESTPLLPDEAGDSDSDDEVVFAEPDTSSFLGTYAGHIVVVYLLGGATLFSATSDNIGWWDGLYFSVLTVTTVGYGDIVPENATMKVACVIYIMVGLSLVATSLGIAAGNMTPAPEPDELSDQDRAKNARKMHVHDILDAIGTIGFFWFLGTVVFYFNEVL